MRKRLMCALWMAFFATLAGFPVWYHLSSGEVFLCGALAPAAAGAVTGAFVQAKAIGERSDLLRATIVGILCAALALPLMIFGVQVIAAFPALLTKPSLFEAIIIVTLFGSVFAIKGLWWLILPMGAVAGLTLQFAWRHSKGRQVASSAGERETQS